MMLKRLLPAALLFAALFSTACHKDASDVWVMAEPDLSVIIPADPEIKGSCDVLGFFADKDVVFNMDVVSKHAPLKSLECSVYDAVGGERVFCSMDLSERSFRSPIAFHTPSFPDKMVLVFTFKAVDEQGYVGKYTTKVAVYPSSESLLEELSAISLYAGVDGKENAFSFTTNQVLFYEEKAPVPEEESSEKPQTLADMVLRLDGGSLGLFTATDVRFARINSFDYPAATASAIRTIYTSSIRSESVASLAADDVILVGRVDKDNRITPLGALKVIMTSADAIVFNYKRIK